MLQRTVLHKNLEWWAHESRQLDVVKQEMVRININILGISELNGCEWMNLIQTTIISTTADKNPRKEMEQTSESTKEYEIQYLGAISKMTERSQLVSKASAAHSFTELRMPLCHDKAMMWEGGPLF